MAYCKKPVYKTMCEADSGIRHGKTKKVAYESRPKRNASKKTKAVTKVKTKVTTKVKTLSKKSSAVKPRISNKDATWKKLGRNIFADDRRMILNDIDPTDELDNAGWREYDDYLASEYVNYSKSRRNKR